MLIRSESGEVYILENPWSTKGKFPIKVRYLDNLQEVICHTSGDIQPGRSFVVVATNVRPLREILWEDGGFLYRYNPTRVRFEYKAPSEKTWGTVQTLPRFYQMMYELIQNPYEDTNK